MDAARFDALTQSFVALLADRRRLLHVLWAGLLALGSAPAWPQGIDARKKRKRRPVHRKRVTADIFGGQNAPVGKYPFVVSIGERGAASARGAHYCGGSLIDPWFVLTAAHCMTDTVAAEMEAIVGRTVLDSSQGERRGVSAIHLHPGYNPETSDYDVAVLRLSHPVTTVQPVALIGAGNQTFEQPNTTLTLVGWGDVSEWTGYSDVDGDYPQHLQELAISVVSDEECDRQWSGQDHKKKKKKGKKGKNKKKKNKNRQPASVLNPDIWVCTTIGRFGYGDSGGPIFASQAGGYVQVTLVSGGDRFKGPDYGPQLSAPVIHDFISSIVNSDSGTVVNVTVLATATDWIGTGVTLQQGQPYTVSYVSGAWSVDANGQPFTGPEGLSPAQDGQLGPGCKYDARFPYGMMIGFIGDEDNGVFAVGQGFSGNATHSGELYLGMNDGAACLEDNAGSVTMAVAV